MLLDVAATSTTLTMTVRCRHDRRLPEQRRPLSDDQRTDATHHDRLAISCVDVEQQRHHSTRRGRTNRRTQQPDPRTGRRNPLLETRVRHLVAMQQSQSEAAECRTSVRLMTELVALNAATQVGSIRRRQRDDRPEQCVLLVMSIEHLGDVQHQPRHDVDDDALRLVVARLPRRDGDDRFARAFDVHLLHQRRECRLELDGRWCRRRYARYVDELGQAV